MLYSFPHRSCQLLLTQMLKIPFFVLKPAMSIKYKFQDQTKPYFVSFAVVNWIDVFIRNEYRNILLDCFRHCQKEKGLEIYSWVIMPSHVHLIIGTQKEKMENIMRDLKSYSAKKLEKAIRTHQEESRREWILWMMERAGKKNSQNKNFQFWRQDNHPIELSDNKMMDQKLDYIHNNPVLSGFTDTPESYLYSSARDYFGTKGLLDIKFIE
jgi:putative transposase